MKAKSVISYDAPEALEDALNEIDEALMARVLVPCLKANPNTFDWGDEFVQVCDFSVRPKRKPITDHICIATLTLVSGPQANWDRGNNDFPRAKSAMIELWSEQLRKFVPRGHRTRLSVVIALDEQIPQRGADGQQFTSNLVEEHGIWVNGEADPAVCPIYTGRRSKR